MSFGVLWRNQARRDLRSKEAVLAGLALVVTFLLVDLFAIADVASDARLAALVVWAPLVYGGLATVARRMAQDSDQGSLDLLRMAPVPWRVHGVVATSLAILWSGLLVALSLAAAHLVFALAVPMPLVATLALATVGLGVVGTVLGGLAAQSRSRDVLLPVLAVPVLAPLVQAGVSATMDAAAGAPLGELSTKLLLMAGYDVLAAGMAWLLWQVLLEAEG